MSKPGNFDAIRDQVREISRISAAVPEEFRLKCFELLMTHLLKSPNSSPPTARVMADLADAAPAVIAIPPSVPVGLTGGPPMSALLSTFVRKVGITNEQFGRVVGYVHGNVVFLREPAGEQGGQVQLEWALLTALKNAVIKGNFLVDPEEVRLVCQEKGVFDRRTFIAVLRRQADLFRAAPEPGGRPQPLSSKGIAALATLVKALADQG